MSDQSIAPLPPFLQRLIHEESELKYKTEKLEFFMTTPAFMELPSQERHDQREQLTYMKGYLEVLGKRVARAKGRA